MDTARRFFSDPVYVNMVQTALFAIAVLILWRMADLLAEMRTSAKYIEKNVLKLKDVVDYHLTTCTKMTRHIHNELVNSHEPNQKE